MEIDPLPRPKCPLPGNSPKSWSYNQYYFGNEDQEKRRNGHGENHWSGAESLEWYSGKFVRDVMHGDGEYRWRYLGPDGAFITYEGRFYANCMHGYGVLSYPDGRVFNGLFCNNMRWGPGIESHSNLEENVGLWYGNRLIRLTWRPNAASVTMDLNTGPVAKKCVEPYRSLLATRTEIIGEVNSAIELLKQNGADPISASEKWTKLYPKYCTDLASQLCHKDLFDYEYYKSRIVYLEEVDNFPELDQSCTDEIDRPNSKTFFAWNNSDVMVSMMKHCFKHEFQRHRSGIDLLTLLTGPRSRYKQPAKHEIDCRILILASYLGNVEAVVQMVNEKNVDPNVADILGNTALMYATCGNHEDIIHFLIEAGANVNSVNDSCCTALGMALIRFACESKDVHASKILQAVLPLTLPGVDATSAQKNSKQKPESELDLEWHMSRDLSVQSADRLATTAKVTPAKKTSNRSAMQLDVGMKDRRKSTMNEITKERKKFDASTNTMDREIVDDEHNDVTEQTHEQRLLHDLNEEFIAKVTDLFTTTTIIRPVAYMFEVVDIVKAAEAITERKISMVPVKSQAPAKNVKETTKTTKELTQQPSEKEISSESSADKVKAEKLNEHITTILQLLSDGADPRLTRCPQPALRIALASGSADLLRLLVKHGADINEVYPNDLNQTILDMAIAQPLTYKNLDQTRAILECGARTDHRLESATGNDPSQPKVQGPTLLHAVLAMHTENDIEEEVRCQLLELLLEHNCDSLAQYNGFSAIDLAMTKDTSLFDVFVKCPKIDPNAIINDENHTILVKMFLTQLSPRVPISERLQILTNLILYGADPMLECQNGNKKYENFFVFANHHLNILSITNAKSTINNKMDVKGKTPNNNKPKKESSNEKQAKSTYKLDELNDFKQALELVKNCARMLHVRWIQAKLLKELIQVVVKYEHRPWSMILPEHKNKKACGLWLSSPRSLEIWEILKSKKKKSVIDKRVLKHVLCIVEFNCNRSKTSFKRPLIAEEKGLIENDVCFILREHKMAASTETESMNLTKPYVTPELAINADAKFQVCFECLLPFEENKILCVNCKQVSFCSQDCMKMNIDVNTGTHPCSEYLKTKYFASSTESYSRSDL